MIQLYSICFKQVLMVHSLLFSFSDYCLQQVNVLTLAVHSLDRLLGVEKGQNELKDTLTISFFVVFGLAGYCIATLAFHEVKRSKLVVLVAAVVCPACDLVFCPMRKAQESE